MRRYLSLFIILVIPYLLSAQAIIQGKIKDVTNNEPLIGAFISLKGTNLVSVSDEKGDYYIITPAPSQPQKLILVVTHLGYRDNFEIVELLPIDDGETIFKDFELEPDPLTLKDVTITANKVEEELQDVPVAATVLDAENLEKRTVSNTEEALQAIPNLITDAYLPSRATFSLRGLASDFTNLGVENSVGLYIDDVFYSRSFNFNQTLIDIQRVEVLRGPQGTLFGKNTVGGVLHIISEKPKFGNYGSIELNAGNFQYFQTRGKANVELVEDKVALRLSGAFRKRDGWLLERNEKVGDENGILFYGGRASLLFKPSEKLEVLLTGNYATDQRADFTIDYKVPDDSLNRLPIDASQMDQFDRKVHQNEEDVFFNRESYGGTARLDYNLGNIHKITSITAFNRSTSAFLRDFDATTVDAAVFGKDAGIKTLSQELRITTPRENRKLFYIAGVYYLQEELSNKDTLAGKPGIAPVWEGLLASFGVPVDLPDNYAESASNGSIVSSTSYAAYVSGSYEISDRIRLNGGLRYNYETKEIEYWQRCNCVPTIPILGSPFLALVAPPIGLESTPIMKDTTNSVVTYNVGMDFKTTDNALLYVNFSRGFKASGFNVGLSPDPDLNRVAFLFEPEFINSYEVGLKLRSGNRFQFNAAAFVTDFKNKQEVVAVGNSIAVSNAKTVQGQGVEGEFTGIWSKFFRTDIALGALNLKYQDFPFPNPDDPFGSSTINLSGNRSFKAADVTFKFAPEFHMDIGRELKLMLRGDLNYVGKAYNDIFNTESLAREPTAVLNARLAISTKHERFSLAIWGKNLTESTYIQHAWSFVFGDHVAVNPPRMVGVELRANFY